MKENEKIRIGFDPYKLRRETDAMPIAISSCSTLKRYLNAVGVKLTNETLKDAISGCHSIEAKIRESIEKDISMIDNPVLIATVTAGTDAAISEMKQNIERLTGLFSVAQFMHLINVVDEVPSLVDNWQNILQERSTNYLSEPKEIAIYRAQMKVIESVNELAEVKGSKVPLENIVFVMFETKNGKAEFQPLNYALLATNAE